MTQTPTPVPFDFAAAAKQAQISDEKIERKRDAAEKYATNPYVQHMVATRESGKAMGLPVPANSVQGLLGYLRDAAKKTGNGLRVEFQIGNGKKFSDVKKLPDKGQVTVRYQGVKPRETTKGGRTTCPVCGRDVSVTGEGKVRSHKVDKVVCVGSGQAPKPAEAPAAAPDAAPATPAAPAADKPAEPPAPNPVQAPAA